MDAEKITQELERRFAAPLKEFYQRRIIFWYDEEREFEDQLDGIRLDGVRIVALTGSNTFAVKMLLCEDDLRSNFLVYDPRSISKDDGSAFEGVKADDDGFLPLGFSDDFEIDFPLIAQITQGYGATGSAYFYDADPTDNAIQLVETRSFESDGNGEISLIGRTLTAHFSTLKLYGEGDPIVLADGSWNLSFPLNYEDASIMLPTGQNFEVSGIPATIDELAISPIALHLRYTAHQKVAWTSGESGRMSEHDTKLTDSLLGTEVTLTMANGTTVAVENNHGGHISENGEVAECDTNIFFDRILDLDEVASITIGGTTIEL